MTLVSEPLQRTDTWQQDRWGRITGSRIKDVMAVTQKGTPGAARTAYLWELVKQRLTEYDPEEPQYVNAAMQHGIDQEANAIAFYEVLNQVEVTASGFIVHPTMPYAGCSPDGLIESPDPGVLEVKCPKTENHLKAIHANVAPEEYLDQCHWAINVTGASYCHLVMYDPRVPEDLQMKVFRIERDDAYIERLEEAIAKFNREINDTIQTIKENI